MHYKFNFKANGLPNNNVRSIYQDRDGDIWIGTKEGGSLSKFDDKTGTFTHYTHQIDDPESISGDNILTIHDAHPGHLWVGTFKNGLNLFNKSTGKVIRFKTENNNTKSIAQDFIYTLLRDKKGRLWIGTSWQGLDLLETVNSPFIHYSTYYGGEGILAHPSVRALCETENGQIWVGTKGGLSVYLPETNNFKSYLNNPQDIYSLGNNDIICLHEDTKNNLWVGTRNGLYFMDVKEEKFIGFTENDGLPSNTIFGILEDDHGNLWLSTSNGISRFTPPTNLSFKQLKANPKKGFFRNYSLNDGLLGNEFEQNAYCKLNDGRMVFGGGNGFNIFHPDSIKDNPNIPEVRLTDFKLFHKKVAIGDENSPLTKAIGSTKSIVLKHTQNTLTFHFTALNYSSPEKNQYAYKLDGLEEDWNNADNQRFATYTNLSPGEYTFMVKASNNDGLWNEKGAEVKINILYPWWATWWFRALIAILISGSAFLFYKYRTNKLKRQKQILENKVTIRTRDLQEANSKIQFQNRQLQYKQTELTKQNEELTATLEKLKLTQSQLIQSEKMASLGLLTAGIAHEINNPVNFIKASSIGLQRIIEKFELVAGLYSEISPENASVKIYEIEELKRNIQFDVMISKATEVTKHINTGVNRTANIVKGLQSFSRSDGGTRGMLNLMEGVENNLLLINYLIKNRIEVITRIKNNHEIECSPEQINQVLMNILVNAVQAIDGEGSIYISTHKKNGQMVIKIKDTGKGISPLDIEKIFDPFFTTKEQGKGTGLGLSISLGIIEEHNGRIEVESRLMQGTTISVILPIVQDLDF